MLSRFRVGLAEFEGIRWLLQLACPVFLVLMVTQVKNLLFPRALGIFGLMVAAPLLSAAFLQEPVTRLLIPIWCYIVIFLSILWIGKPYLYRDMVNKICSKPAWMDASLPGRNGLWSRHSALRHPMVVGRPPLPAPLHHAEKTFSRRRRPPAKTGIRRTDLSGTACFFLLLQESIAVPLIIYDIPYSFHVLYPAFLHHVQHSLLVAYPCPFTGGQA